MTLDSKPSPSMIVGILVALLIGLVAGFVIGDYERSPEVSLKPPLSPGPTRELNGVPVGYARTPEGAVAAATNFSLLAGDDELVDLPSMKRAMRTLAAPSWREEATTQAESGHEYIVGTYGEDADVTVGVIRYDVLDFSRERAAVQLWTVSIASGSKRPEVEEVWAILRIDLLWIDGDWRVEGIESSVGPAPVDVPSGDPGDSATSLMEEFDEFEGAPLP